jgi:hypothetical protein
VDALKKLPTPPAAVLEIHQSLGAETPEVSERIEKSFALLG